MELTIHKGSWILALCLFVVVSPLYHTGRSWHRGCYHLPGSGKISSRPHYKLSHNWTPAKCSKRCLDKGYSYAYLFNGNVCFCHQQLSTPAYTGSCSHRCPRDALFRCGGSKTASVYSRFGPYISEIDVSVNPARVMKNEVITVIVDVELAFDASVKTGIRQIDRESSFRQAEVMLKLDRIDFEMRQNKKIVSIRSRKGKVQFSVRCRTDGLKMIDVIVKNAISEVSGRAQIYVGRRKPTGLHFWLDRKSTQSCTPSDSGIFDFLLVNETIIFYATVGSGFNLTFNWTFCGEVRTHAPYLEDLQCLGIDCQSSQGFTFRNPRQCQVKIRVFNKYGSTEQSKLIEVITPQFRDLGLVALPSEWHLKSQTPMFDSQESLLPWKYSVPVYEGATSGRGGQSRPQQRDSPGPPINLFPFGDLPPEMKEQQKVPDNHIPLDKGQYLMGTPVTFEAIAFRNIIDENVNIEIDFGDGDGWEGKLELYPFISSGLGRKKRSLEEIHPDNSYVNKGKAKEGQFYNALEKVKSRPKRRSWQPSSEDYLQDMGNSSPYAPRDGTHLLPAEDNAIAQSDNPVTVNHDPDCYLRLKFEHKYHKAGKYNVTVRLQELDSSHSLFTGLNTSFFILNGTAELNIRCPEIVELGKSEILSASSIIDLSSLIWRISSRASFSENWRKEDIIEQSELSLKRTFLWRGLYRIQVISSERGLFSSCQLQVEEPLSGLSVATESKYVRTGTDVELQIRLRAGTAVDLTICSDDRRKKHATIGNKGKWTAYFSVTEPKCYSVYVNAENPISRLKSNTVNVCGEEQIYGLAVTVPEFVDLKSKIVATITLKSGSNVYLVMEIFSLSGRKVSSQQKRIHYASAGKVMIHLPETSEIGRYRVVARASNHVPARSATCNNLAHVESVAWVHVTKLIPESSKLTLRRKSSIGSDNQAEDMETDFVYSVSVKGLPRRQKGNWILYAWSLESKSKNESHTVITSLTHYTSSPLFTVSFQRCVAVKSSIDDVKKTVKFENEILTKNFPQCGISVSIISPERNSSDTLKISVLGAFLKKSLIYSRTGVIESKKPCEFDIKCPEQLLGMCTVTFGSELMNTTFNTNWTSLTHTFDEAGFYEITLSTSETGTEERKVLSVADVMVQERILSLALEGSFLLSYEINPNGAWRAKTQAGSHQVYRWSIVSSNNSLLSDEFTRGPEWGFRFPDVGEYTVKLAVFNDVSRQVIQKIIKIRHSPWYFNVKANSSTLGQPSTFNVSTNASLIILSVKFDNATDVRQFDLSCLDPHFVSNNDESGNVKSYIISHVYNQTGTYEAAFSLLSTAVNDRSKRLYTIKTEVLHRPAPRSLQLSISQGEFVDKSGNYYVAVDHDVMLRASTNFFTHFFSWNVYRIQDSQPINTSMISARNNTSELPYKFEQPGRHKVLVVAHQEKIHSVLYLTAEVNITKVWMEEPYSSKDRKFVEHCKLKRVQVTGSSEYKCDSLTLTAFSDGTGVTFFFHIRYRPQIRNDYSAPTEVIEVIKAPQRMIRDSNEASIEYSFSRQGVFAITVTARNHLGQISAEIPPVKQLDRPARPFLLYAQRGITRISLDELFFVALEKSKSFKLHMSNPNQIVDIEWDMGDSTKLKGQVVEHVYRHPGEKKVIVTVKNYIQKKKVAATVVVQMPVQDVKVEEKPGTYSTARALNLRAIVKPRRSATDFMWYLGLNKTKNVTSPNVSYQFTKSGMHLVKVIASNQISSEESAAIEIELQDPIVADFIGDKVVQMNSDVNMSVFLISGSDVTVQWMIDGQSILGSLYWMAHVFDRVGVYTVQVDLTNKLGNFSIEKQIFVMDRPCQIPELNITRKNQREIMVKRSKSLRLEVDVNLNCSFRARVNYNWKVRQAVLDDIYGSTGKVGDELDLLKTDTYNRVLEIPPRTLPYGNFSITVNVSIEGTILFKEAEVRVDVFPSRLVAKIENGNLRNVSRSSHVTINASSSYDPDYPSEQERLEFEWQCFVLHSPSIPCFNKNNRGGTGNIAEESATSSVPPFTTSSSSMREADEYFNNDDSEGKVYKNFPAEIQSNYSVLSFPAKWLVDTAYSFVFRLEVISPTPFIRRRVAAIVLKMTNERMEWVKIYCRNCHDGQVARHIPLQFDSSCPTCEKYGVNSSNIRYKWSVQEVDDESASFYKNETSDCAPRNGEGWMSIFGVFGNDSGNTNGSDTDAILTHFNEGRETELPHEDQNFYGNVVPDKFLQEGWPQQGQPVSSPHALFPGDVHEARSGSFRQQDGEAIADNPKPSRSSRALRTVPTDSEEFTLPPTPDDQSAKKTPKQQQVTETSNMRGADSSDHQPLGQTPSESVREAEVNPDRFSMGGHNGGPYGPNVSGYDGRQNDRYMYRNSQKPTSPPPHPGIQSSAVVDAFRADRPSSSVPKVDHYQDLKHIELALSEIALSATNQKTLILRPNALTEGRTYAVTMEVFSEDDNQNIGKTLYYFTILRGPSYGDCSVLYRMDKYWVHCAGFKNQQNDNTKDKVSRRELLRFEMSYSLEKNSRRRHIYSGVSNEKGFHLPRGNIPAYIHIVLKNNNGASTNVCSFLPDGPKNQSLSEEELLQQIYNQSVPEDSKLKRMVAIGNQEDVISLSNVILDTIPDDGILVKMDRDSESLGTKDTRDIVYNVFAALKSIRPREIKEVQYVVEAVTRALSRGNLISGKAFFEATELLMSSIDSLRKILDGDNYFWDRYVLSDEELVKMMIAARVRLSDSCKSCAQRIRSQPKSGEVEDALRKLEKETGEKYRSISFTSKLIEKEKEIYDYMNIFFLDLCKARHPTLGPLRSAFNGYGIMVQRYNNVAQLFNNNDLEFDVLSPWHVGAVFPEMIGSSYSSEEVSEFYTIASTVPDMTLRNYQRSFVERRPLSLFVFNGTYSEMHLRALSEPVTIALPPRECKKIIPLKGTVIRDKVSFNMLQINSISNKTMHIEIVIDTSHHRSFPISIAITNVTDLSRPPIYDKDRITKQVISRAEFKEFHSKNESIVKKFILRDDEFNNFGRELFLALWNEHNMTSRSRYYDTDEIPYTLRVWWSDCYYFDHFFVEWRRSGVKVSEDSTYVQTLCTATHLSSFSASMIPVKTDTLNNGNEIDISRTAFGASVTMIVLVTAVFALFLCIHRRILRPRELKTPTSVFRLDSCSSSQQFSEIGKRLRWFFGPDQEPNGVPIILHDNRKEHKQVFEVTIQTCCWPGSGTTSNVSIILYGEEGKYAARELISPKTHNAREARYENGYSENDDYIGADDELFITGATQRFTVSFPENLGDLEKLLIWHENSGESPSWQLDYITVRDTNDGRKWHFPHYGWIASERGKKSISAELKPLDNLPNFHEQICLKLSALFCNFSSVCALIVAPGYGQSCRRQRAVHLFALFLTICALATGRFMLGLDIYSHETDLPYIHGGTVHWGLLIGLLATVIVVPAHLLNRCSKHDDRISVMIEDVTESSRGSEFPEEIGSYRYASSYNIDKPPEEYQRRPPIDVGYDHYQGNDDYNLPSVQDAVCDWLEVKALSERKPLQSGSEVDKDLPLPEARSITSPNWRNSINSLDEEIIRCMISSSSRSSQLMQENAASSQKHESPENENRVKDTFLHVPSQVHNASFRMSPRLKIDLASMLQSGSLLSDQYEALGGAYNSVGSTLAMDGPELVPCEKLEPMAQDFSLPRGCRKFALCYYVTVCIVSIAITFYGTFVELGSYDVGAWLECIVFSVVSTFVFIEGSLILTGAVLSSVYNKLKLMFTNEDLRTILDRAFSSDQNNPSLMESSTNFYIDSTCYYPTPGIDCHSPVEESMQEDARMARELADRERSRYLRHVEPPSTPPAGQKDATKRRRVKKSSAQWGNVIFLLVLGLASAAILSKRYDEVIRQSEEIESWLVKTSTFPSFQRFVLFDTPGVNVTGQRNVRKIRTRNDWLDWLDNVLLKSSTEKKEFNVNRRKKQSNYLLRDATNYHHRFDHRRDDVRYVVISKPLIRLQRCDQSTCMNPPLEKMARIMNCTNQFNSKAERKAAGIKDINAVLKDNEVQEILQKKKRSACYDVTKWAEDTMKTRKQISAFKKAVKGDMALESLSLDTLLYEPTLNMYSHLSVTTKFRGQSGPDLSEPTKIQVKSLVLSLRGYDPTHLSASHKTFYLCQMLFLLWASCKFLRSGLKYTNWEIKKLTNPAKDAKKKSKHKNKASSQKIVALMLDFVIWVLVILCIAFSAAKRACIEVIMPYIYGYSQFSEQQNGALQFDEAHRSSFQLTAAYGLLNFFLFLKVLVILRRHHNFPRVPTYAKSRKSALGQVFLVLGIFWTAVFILASISYLLFCSERSFKSFIHSLMTVVISSISLGNFPAHTSNDLLEMRAKHGTIVTLGFFLVIFVTFRLLLKALLIATYSKRPTNDSNSKSKTKVKVKRTQNWVTFKDLIQFNWEMLCYLAVCVACILLRRDPGLFYARADVEFTSLAFTKSKNLSEREKEKIGYSSSNRSQKSTPPRERAEKCKTGQENGHDLPEKYELPAKSLFSEIETQLDELNTRASALVELELLEDLELYSKKPAIMESSKDNIFATPTQIVCPPISTAPVPLRTEKFDEGGNTSEKAEENEVTNEEQKLKSSQSVNARKPPIRRTSKDKNTKQLRKIHPRKQKSSVLNKRRISPTQIEKNDSGTSAESRNSTPGLNSHCRTPHSPLSSKRATAPVAKMVALRKAAEKTNWPPISCRYVISNIGMQDGRRTGWISDDDMLDHSVDVSVISASSFSTCGTPVPPLTQHNLARHNHHILSHQTSTGTVRAISSTKTVRLSDIPSTSSAPYESPPEESPSFARRIWTRLSHFKNIIKKEESVQQVQIKDANKAARPLRRSRTVGINIKDIPSFSNPQDSDADSDRTGKKSSASTTKIRSVLAISKLRLCDTVEENPRASDQSVTYSHSLQSEMTSLPSRFDDGTAQEDIETFNIPGTVPNSTRNSPMRQGGRSKTPKSVQNMQASNAHHTVTRRCTIPFPDNSNFNSSGIHFSTRIKEEVESNDGNILEELKARIFRQ